MNDLEITPKVLLEVIRCWECGRWWALEKGIAGTCPSCAERKIKAANGRADAAERSARASRGAATRARQR